MAQVSDAINTLQSRAGLTVEALASNEAFISLLCQATPIALRHHQQEKLVCLKNALISVGSPEFTDEDLAFQFLRYIDELTVSHLSVLRVIWEDEGAFKNVKSMQHAFKLLDPVAPNVLSPLVLRTFLRDLDVRGLVNASDLEDLPGFESKAVYIASEQSDRHPLRLTEIGKTFLKFVAD